MVICEILVPMINPNEPEVRIAAVHAREGQAVEKGTLLMTLETTKAAEELEADRPGFFRPLVKTGDLLSVGARLAFITSESGEPLPSEEETIGQGVQPDEELRITRPARLLAEQFKLDLKDLPRGRLITESVVRSLLPAVPLPEGLGPFDSARHLLVFGGGGHARTVIELVKAVGGFEIAGILDDNLPSGSQVLGLPVLGDRRLLQPLVEAGLRLAANGVGGIVDIDLRVRIFELLETSGFAFPALLHPRASIEPSAQVAQGVQVFSLAYVGSCAVLKDRCMVNTGAVVSHDCVVGAWTHIAPGVLLAGHVQVGEKCLVGMGVTTAIGICIGNAARIGNSAVLLADVPDHAIVPAGRVWKGKTE